MLQNGEKIISERKAHDKRTKSFLKASPNDQTKVRQSKIVPMFMQCIESWETAYS